LATFFVIILGSAYALGHRPYGEPVVDSKSRLWAAIQTSVGLFWDTALLFGLAVAVAALVSTKTSGSSYDNVFATLSSSISVSVVLLTWPLYYPTCRHRTARWAAICVLAAINSFLLISWLAAGDLTRESKPFEIHCVFWHISEGNTYGVASASYYYGAVILSSLSLTLVAAYACHQIFSWVKKRNGGPKPAWASTALRVLVIIWCGLMFTLMYTNMMSLALFRYTAANKAGPSLRENDWGFSQVMALATWVPTVLDFVLIFKGEFSFGCWIGLTLTGGQVIWRRFDTDCHWGWMCMSKAERRCLLVEAGRGSRRALCQSKKAAGWVQGCRRPT